jgi:pimeloyl-ACP methyl ester carboxylesterase
MPEVALKDGGKLFYETHGTGEPVLFLNGIMMATRSWDDHVQALSGHIRLILVDFRDQGRSSRLDRDYDLGLHVFDLVELLDALGLDRVHLMGLSYGGEVATLFALEHADRLRSLILSNVPLRTSNYLAALGDAWTAAAELGDGDRFFKLAIPHVYSAHFYERELEWLETRRRWFGRAATREWFDGLVRLCKAAARYEMSPDRLRTIGVPTLLIGADEDLIAPLRDLDVFRESIPRCEMVVLRHAGHGAFQERCAELCTVLLGFVRKHGMQSK